MLKTATSLVAHGKSCGGSNVQKSVFFDNFHFEALKKNWLNRAPFSFVTAVTAHHLGVHGRKQNLPGPPQRCAAGQSPKGGSVKNH